MFSSTAELSDGFGFTHHPAHTFKTSVLHRITLVLLYINDDVYDSISVFE